MLVLVVFFSLFGHGGSLGFVTRAVLSYPCVVTLLTHWFDMNDDGLLSLTILSLKANQWVYNSGELNLCQV